MAPNKKTLQTDVLDTIASRYRSGESLDAIAREFSMARSTLWLLLKQCGVNKLTSADRFWLNVDTSSIDGCWPWLGWRDDQGYGYFNDKKDESPKRAHRYAWALVNGPIEDGTLILHECDNPPCCRVGPKHLYKGTHFNNNRDTVARGRFPSRDGERHPGARLTAAQVIEIRRRVSVGESRRLIAAAFDISASYVSMLANGKGWSHIKELFPIPMHEPLPKVERMCEVCGITFIVGYWYAKTHPARFCSDRCKGLAFAHRIGR